MKKTILVLVLVLEGINAFIGGLLLIASPDGEYLGMPVTIMHGVFHDFLIPGMILSGMGILSIIAVVAIFSRSSIDWILAGLALIGFIIWFVVQIIILKDINLLHVISGIPILIGIWTAFHLIPSEKKLFLTKHTVFFMRGGERNET